MEDARPFTERTTRHIGLTLSRSEHEALKEYSWKTRLSMSEVIRRSIRREIERAAA